jgi:hypothetical protein
MTSITNTSLIEILKKCGATEGIRTHIKYKGSYGCLYVVIKFNVYQSIYSVASDLQVAIEDVVTGVIRELSADWDITRDYMSVADGGYSNGIEVDFGFQALPRSNEAECEDYSWCRVTINP